jgi:hypothetical protein
MRVCADRHSDYYMGDERYEVWLDGKRLTHVIEADEENGWAIVHSDVGSTYRKILRGRVTILNPRLLPIPCFRVTGAARMIPLPALLAAGWIPATLCEHGYAERIKV